MKADFLGYLRPCGPESQQRRIRRRRRIEPERFEPFRMTAILATTLIIMILSCQLTIVPVSGYYFTFSNPLNWSWFNWYGRSNQTVNKTLRNLDTAGNEFTLLESSNLTSVQPMFQSLKLNQNDQQPQLRKKAKKSYELSDTEKDLKVDLYMAIKKITEANQMKRETEQLGIQTKPEEARTEFSLMIGDEETSAPAIASTTAEYEEMTATTSFAPELVDLASDSLFQDKKDKEYLMNESNIELSEFTTLADSEQPQMTNKNPASADNDHAVQEDVKYSTTQFTTVEENSSVGQDSSVKFFSLEEISPDTLVTTQEPEIVTTSSSSVVPVTANSVIKLLLRSTNQSIVEARQTNSNMDPAKPQFETTTTASVDIAKEEKPVFILFGGDEQNNLTDDDYIKSTTDLPEVYVETSTSTSTTTESTELPESRWDRMEVRTEISRNSIVDSIAPGFFQSQPQLPTLVETTTLTAPQEVADFYQASTSTSSDLALTTTEVSVNQSSDINHQRQFIQELLALRNKPDSRRVTDEEPKPIYNENWKIDEEVGTKEQLATLTTTTESTSFTTTPSTLTSTTTPTTTLLTTSTTYTKKKANKMLLNTDDGSIDLYNIPATQNLMTNLDPSTSSADADPKSPNSSKRFLQNFQNFYSSSSIFDDLMQQYSSGSSAKDIFGSSFIDPNDLNSISFPSLESIGNDQLNQKWISPSLEQLLTPAAK